MPKIDNQILKYNHGEMPMKLALIIYADMESLLNKIHICHSNPKKSLKTKINKHIASGYHSGYHRYFIIKELAEEFKGQFKYLGEHIEKYINFSVLIKNVKKITYKITFIDNFRFMLTSLSNLFDNLSSRLHSD